MSAAKHTTAPWSVSPLDPRDPAGLWINAQFQDATHGSIKGSVCRAYSHLYLTQDECDANARLIAAAPDLLEALQRLMPTPLTGNPTHAQLVDFWTYEKQQGRGEAADVLFALAAIAKATGSAA